MTAGALIVGFAAGVVAGMLGVGGGILFVPALVLFLDLPQVDAEATSLLAIIPVALVGAASQRRYGNLRLRDAVVLGVLAVPGAIAGVAIVNAIPERTVEVLFALLMLYVAAQLVRRALTPVAEADA
ncbi:MAG: sulfite exporter TauE/SafE family protein [Conexibacter sp.]|nr:sulfite exporter TauE/SafE family protein [Conexibacter sp.]